MNKQIKSMPESVRVAIVFLIAVYVAMCIMAPWIGLALGVGVGIILAMVRVAHYLHFGN